MKFMFRKHKDTDETIDYIYRKESGLGHVEKKVLYCEIG